jgi:CDP-diacylglycerol---glycerol-3-phosphate 3-phosphatidyltransferase
MNLPNFLTLSRIFLVPIIVAFLLTRTENWEYWGTGLFLAASLTDWLDGYVARKRQQITTLGTLLDPIADKLLICSAFIALVELKLVQSWMVVIIVGREFAVSGLRNIAASEGFTISASRLGKMKMFIQVAAITLLILAHRFQGSLILLAQFTLAAVVVLAIVSMIQYFLKFWGQIDESIKHRERRRMRLLKLRARRHKEQLEA